MKYWRESVSNNAVLTGLGMIQVRYIDEFLFMYSIALRSAERTLVRS